MLQRELLLMINNLLNYTYDNKYTLNDHIFKLGDGLLPSLDYNIHVDENTMEVILLCYYIADTYRYFCDDFDWIRYKVITAREPDHGPETFYLSDADWHTENVNLHKNVIMEKLTHEEYAEYTAATLKAHINCLIKSRLLNKIDYD
jgi:hypothetical protein